MHFDTVNSGSTFDILWYIVHKKKKKKENKERQGERLTSKKVGIFFFFYFTAICTRASTSVPIASGWEEGWFLKQRNLSP